MAEAHKQIPWCREFDSLRLHINDCKVKQKRGLENIYKYKISTINAIK